MCTLFHLSDGKFAIFSCKEVVEFIDEWNGIDFQVREAERVVGLNVRHDGFRFVEWQSVVAFVKHRLMSTCWSS